MNERVPQKGQKICVDGFVTKQHITFASSPNTSRTIWTVQRDFAEEVEYIGTRRVFDGYTNYEPGEYIDGQQWSSGYYEFNRTNTHHVFAVRHEDKTKYVLPSQVNWEQTRYIGVLLEEIPW